MNRDNFQPQESLNCCRRSCSPLIVRFDVGTIRGGHYTWHSPWGVPPPPRGLCGLTVPPAGQSTRRNFWQRLCLLAVGEGGVRRGGLCLQAGKGVERRVSRATWRRRSEAGLIFCWNRTLSARFCCSRSKTRVRSFRHSSLRSCGPETEKGRDHSEEGVEPGLR